MARDDAATVRATGGRGRPDLVNGPITRSLLLFALPTMGGNILQSLNGTVNAVWIGRFLGEGALAATSNANTIMFLMFAAVFGLAMATSILIGQAVGARDLPAARRVLAGSLGLITALSLVIATLGWLGTPALLRALSTPGAAMPLAAAYLRVIFVGMPFTFGTVLLSAALRGSGDAVTPLRAMVLNVVLDAGLNPLLIRGIGPFPALGIAGSALATLLAGFITVTALVAYAYWKRLPLALGRSDWTHLRPAPTLVRALLGRGLPMGLSMIVLSASALAMMGLVNRQGVATAAAFGANLQLWTYIQMPALAIGAGVSAMVAQNIGAGRWDRVGRIALSGCIVNTAITAAGVVAVALADRTMLALFLGGTSAAMPIATHIATVVNWSFLFFSVSIVLTSVVRANGAVYPPLVILFIAFFPVRFGAALALLPRYGADAVWWSYPLGSVTAAGLTVAYFVFGNWRAAAMAPGHARQRTKA